MNKEKVVRCLILPCRFNKLCKSCANISTPHLRSDSRCVNFLKNWQSAPQNFRKLFHKISIKEHSPDEILLVCPEHIELFAKALEMEAILKNSLENEEFIEGLRSLNELYQDYYECKIFLNDFLGYVMNFIKETPKEIEETDDVLIEKISISLRIFSFVIMKDMKIKQLFRKDEILVESLVLWLTKNEYKLKINEKIKKIAEKLLFIINNLNNMECFSEVLTEELFNFGLRNLDSQDFDLYFHIISLLWSLCYIDKIKIELKELHGVYFFKFFNENNGKMDLQFQELLIGFLLFIFAEEIKQWKQLKIREDEEENKEIEKFMFFLEKNQQFYSYRVSCLF